MVDKRAIGVLCNGDGAICWLIGHRIDERFKVQEDTAYCLALEWQASSAKFEGDE